jgi:hypothetical protein
MKPSDKMGSDDLQERFQGMKIEKTEHYKSDPSGIRTGNGPGPEYADILEKVAQDAEEALDAKLVVQKRSIDISFLQEKLDNIRGAVTMG